MAVAGIADGEDEPALETLFELGVHVDVIGFDGELGVYGWSEEGDARQ